MADYDRTNFYDPTRPFRWWLRDQIRQTTDQTDKYIPNIGDGVMDWEQGMFRVTDLEQGTWIPTLVPWYPPTKSDTDGDENVLVGVGPGYSSESYRCFLDTSVTPHTLAPDRRLHFYGSMVSGYKVFLGSDISEEYGKIISAFYDSSGEYMGPIVPVEVVQVPDAPQAVIKAPMVGFTAEELVDGEKVTLVAYDDKGGVVSIAQLLIQNTEAIRQSDTSKRYVKGIAIDTPFISAADPKVIEFPLNVTVESLPMNGLVTYRGGKQVRLGINTQQMSLLGLENYIATEIDQEFPLTLVYQLAEDEISYALTPTADRSITENYIARTVAADGAYTCRLFVYPVWVSATAGYRLEFWLYNLDRQRFYNVTALVELGTNSAAYDPKSYGTLQTLTFAVNLNKVDGRFAPHRFVSTFQIALLQSGETQANWEVYPRPDSGASYGRDLIADLDYIQTNAWDLRLQNGASTKEAWLRKMYEAAEPLVNPATEAVAPTPTHFKLIFLHNTYEFSVEQWNQVLRVNNDLLNNGELLYIQWIRRLYDSDLQLAMTAVPVYRRS